MSLVYGKTMLLTKTQFLALACLARRPMHIYAMRQEITTLSDHFYKPTGSTLKQAVNVLINKDLIEECRSNPHYLMMRNQGVPYELTPDGRFRLEQETAVYFKACQVIRMWGKKPVPFRPPGR